MVKGIYLGEFEQLLLMAVLRLGENAYGMTIRDEIIRRTGRIVSRGAVYAGLDRLETKGLVVSRLGEPISERGGRARRHYKTNAGGEFALAASLKSIRRMADGLGFLRRQESGGQSLLNENISQTVSKLPSI
jgi:PadR family transcriptional regulator